MDVEHHSSGSRRAVRNVHLSMSHLPDEPCIERSGKRTAFLYLIFYPFYIVYYPFYFRTAEIRVCHKACLLPYQLSVFFRKVIGVSRHSSILPYDRIVKRLSCDLVPHHHGLALIVDPDAADLVSAYAADAERHIH